jgi:hypothetical protein
VGRQFNPDSWLHFISGNHITMPENIKPELNLDQLRALPSVEQDFSTPEGAVLCLVDAYRRKKIEAVCACKNFMIEGTVALLNMDPNLARNPEIRKKNALLTERAFKKQIMEAWPDLKDVESFFVDRQIYHNGLVVVYEIRRSPDGTFTEHYHLVANTATGWTVLNEISYDEYDELD